MCHVWFKKIIIIHAAFFPLPKSSSLFNGSSDSDQDVFLHNRGRIVRFSNNLS